MLSDKYPSDWSTRRKEIYNRDDHTCQNCGLSGSDAELHAHHIVPISNGGTHSKSNLKTLCKECHSAVHNDTLAPTANLSRANSEEGAEINPFVNISDFENCPICGEANSFNRISSLRVDPNEIVAYCDSCKTEFSVKDTSKPIFYPSVRVKISRSRYDIEGYEISPIILKRMENNGGENIDEIDKYSRQSSEYISKFKTTINYAAIIMIISAIIGILTREFIIPVVIIFLTVFSGFVIFKNINSKAKRSSK